jgi:hypothetical protein
VLSDLVLQRVSVRLRFDLEDLIRHHLRDGFRVDLGDVLQYEIVHDLPLIMLAVKAEPAGGVSGVHGFGEIISASFICGYSWNE